MSIATQTATQLGLTGTDSEIVAVLKSTGLTARPINRAELIHLLNMRGMLRKIVGNNSDEKWMGTILNMQDAILAVGTDEQKNGIRLWFSHVTNPSNQLWDTTVLAFAGAFWQLYRYFAGMPGMPSDADFRAIADLGGGWLFADLAVEDFAAQRQAAESLAAKQAIIAATRQTVSLLSAKATAVNAWCDALDLATKSPEEVQAYCDSLLASSDGNPA